MDKKMSNRFKQLIGESIAEDKKPLLSSENVTDESLADRLSEMESSKMEAQSAAEAEEKELSEGWDMSEEEVISEGGCDHEEDETCPNCEEDLINESEDTVYDLSFLNEEKEK